jgi:hypothetical protein
MLSAQCADKEGHADAKRDQEKRDLGSHVEIIDEVVSDAGSCRVDPGTVCLAMVCFSVAQSATCTYTAHDRHSALLQSHDRSEAIQHGASFCLNAWQVDRASSGQLLIVQQGMSARRRRMPAMLTFSSRIIWRMQWRRSMSACV